MVSIHAPAWGATHYVQVKLSDSPLVSIHAPAWGATRHALQELLPALVSIHAPAWGATLIGGQDDTAKKFQSTRPRGARLALFRQIHRRN